LTGLLTKIVRSDANTASSRNLDRLRHVLLSDRHAMPTTWGIGCPAEMPASEARQRGSRRLRIVMLHEMGAASRAGTI
jgi:hypothetical protein